MAGLLQQCKYGMKEILMPNPKGHHGFNVEDGNDFDWFLAKSSHIKVKCKG